MIVLAATALAHRERSPADRARPIAVAVGAIALVAAMHGARHVGGFRMAGTGGFAIAPTPAVVSWPF